MSQKIRVSLNFHKPDAQIVTDAVGAYDGLKDNPEFVNPPIPLVLKTAIDTYASMIAAAADGGKQAIIDRRVQLKVGLNFKRRDGGDRPNRHSSCGWRASLGAPAS